MKIYTENEVIGAIMWSQTYKYLSEGDISKILSKLKPIEIPTDNEIDQHAIGHSTFAPSFSYGAKWMREQITEK